MNISHTNIDFNNRMICIIQDDVIYEMNGTGQTQAIGRTNKWCDELIEVAQEYKQMCVDNGLIEEEKTAEQIQAEQLQMMQQMMSVITDLKNEVEVLKNGHNENGGTGSKSTGSKSKSSKSSSDTSDEESTGDKLEK